MFLPILLSSTLLATTTIRTNVSAGTDSSASVSINQEINAQSSRTVSTTTRQEIRRSVNGEVNQTIVINRCERVTENVNNHTRAGETVKEKRIRIHQGVVKRLQALLAKLEERDCDTTSAKSNLATWEVMINNYINLFNDWLDSLHRLQNQVCQESATDYKTSLQAVHTKRKLAQDKKREISNFYINTLRPSVKELRLSCKITP